MRKIDMELQRITQVSAHHLLKPAALSAPARLHSQRNRALPPGGNFWSLKLTVANLRRPFSWIRV
jgi:hypothetical protein